MAEIMLLLVFCLLIAVAAVVADGTSEAPPLEDRNVPVQTTEALQERIAALERENAELISQTEPLRRQINILVEASDIPPDWDVLRRIDTAVRETEIQVTSIEEVVRAIPAAIEIAAAQIAPETVMSELAFARDLAEAFQDSGEPRPPVDALRDAFFAGRGSIEDQQNIDWPPLISLSEAGGYNFDSGSASLDERFEQALQGEVVDMLVKLIAQYNVDVVEVIGHTDEVPLGSSTSNLDDSLVGALEGSLSVEEMRPADNAGLGMARAVSVARILQRTEGLQDVAILPLSGAQLIDLGDHVTSGASRGDVPERRRIEIRLRRSSEVVTSGE
jgi:outer membrane protein OmpA-like peptidoglycan-associated protein